MHGALRAQGRDVTLFLVEGGDHGFSTDTSDQTGKGLASIFDQVLSWFLKT